MIPKLGRVKFLPIREVWPNEATSFTPWLLENEDLLSDLLRIELTLHRREQPVGNFSLDLIGENMLDGSKIIIENQLEKTDHNHLGQLLTYAGGLEPKTIVWIAANFRDEHRAALDWLNRVTDENTHFFGIELKAVKIGDSAPAPWMEVIVEPNAWNEQIKRSSAEVFRSEVSAQYLEFWELLVEKYADAVPEFRDRQLAARNYFTVRIGKSNVLLALVFAKEKIRVEIYFGSSDQTVNEQRFEELYNKRQEVEEIFGAPLTWENLEGKKACRISFYGEGSIQNKTNWNSYMIWFKEYLFKLKSVTDSAIFQNIVGTGQIEG